MVFDSFLRFFLNLYQAGYDMIPFWRHRGTPSSEFPAAIEEFMQELVVVAAMRLSWRRDLSEKKRHDRNFWQKCAFKIDCPKLRTMEMLFQMGFAIYAFKTLLATTAPPAIALDHDEFMIQI